MTLSNDLKISNRPKLQNSTDCRGEITAYFRSFPQANTSKDADLWIPTDTKHMVKSLGMALPDVKYFIEASVAALRIFDRIDRIPKIDGED